MMQSKCQFPYGYFTEVPYAITTLLDIGADPRQVSPETAYQYLLRYYPSFTAPQYKHAYVQQLLSKERDTLIAFNCHKLYRTAQALKDIVLDALKHRRSELCSGLSTPEITAITSTMKEVDVLLRQCDGVHLNSLIPDNRSAIHSSTSIYGKLYNLRLILDANSSTIDGMRARRNYDDFNSFLPGLTNTFTRLINTVLSTLIWDKMTHSQMVEAVKLVALCANIVTGSNKYPEYTPHTHYTDIPPLSIEVAAELLAYLEHVNPMDILEYPIRYISDDTTPTFDAYTPNDLGCTYSRDTVPNIACYLRYLYSRCN